MRHARVVGNDVKKLAPALQRADDLRPPPLQNADDRAGLLPGARGTQALGPDIAPHEHAVFMHRGGRGVLRNDDFLQARIIRLQKTLSLAVHPNPARDEVRLAREDVAIALGAGQPSALLQQAQRPLQFLLAIGRQTQPAQ